MPRSEITEITEVTDETEKHVTTRWSEMTPACRERMTANMPALVAKRIRDTNGDISDDEMKRYFDHYYDFDHVIKLYKVSDTDRSVRSVLRQTSCDVFDGTLKDVKRLERLYRFDSSKMSRSQIEIAVLSMNLKPAPGYHWEVFRSRLEPMGP